MHYPQAEIQVLEAEITIVRGLRLSPQSNIALAAANRENALLAELDSLRFHFFKLTKAETADDSLGADEAK